ncbi:unnamed protein product [Vicia faba]|uniref:Uncharacterized protein n=1 Tax=Vicia faba TaxID=3906 RepID=A0AAV1AKS1_VICFA|nr:unnamed protein product [Vicia faba]
MLICGFHRSPSDMFCFSDIFNANSTDFTYQLEVKRPKGKYNNKTDFSMELQDFLIHARVFKLYRQATNVVSWLNDLVSWACWHGQIFFRAELRFVDKFEPQISKHGSLGKQYFYD